MPRDDDDDEIRFNQERAGEVLKLVPFAFGAAILGLLLLKSVTVIQAGHVGIKDLFGRVYEEPLASGFHLINPLLRVHRISVRTQELKEVAVTPSREGLTVNLEISLLFRVLQDQSPVLYRTVGQEYVGVIVEPMLRSVVRGVTASYEAKALYTAEREAMSNEIFNHLKPQLAARGIVVEQILLRSVQLPSILSVAIEKKLEAEQQSEQMKFVLEKESREADRKRIAARGISDYQRIVSQGLSEQLLKWKGIEATEKLAESHNAKVVVVGSGKDGLPLILGGN